MKCLLVKMDYTFRKSDWWMKDFESRDLNDFMMQCGAVIAEKVYAEIYDVDEQDDPEIVKKAREILKSLYPLPAHEAIRFLFKLTVLISRDFDAKKNQA